MRRLILTNHQSPGDIVMLTAAVRDLHLCYPGQFVTDVRTPCAQLWDGNPFITSLSESDPDTEPIYCHYPLVHSSNAIPVHFLEGFIEYLNRELDREIQISVFRGDIHLSDEERRWPPLLENAVGEEFQYWLVCAGGKSDFTVKWWDTARYQQVVDAFAGRIVFVQIGGAGHHHPPLENVIDLRGCTDLRQLIQLVHHAEGVLTPVSLAMHLAAAVEGRPGRPLNRPCVVVAGGREPPHWEAYPHHQFIHTVGALRCCDNGGCWKARTLPLGDGDPGDLPENLCVDVRGNLPACMDLITADDVVRRIDYYRKGGVLSGCHGDSQGTV